MRYSPGVSLERGIEPAGEPKVVLLMRLLNAIDEGRHGFEALKTHISLEGKPPSTRSLRRYLSILAAAGFPWFFDRQRNVYRFADGYSLKRLELSRDELFGVVALRALGSSLGGSLGATISGATEKLVGSSRASALPARSSLAFRVPSVTLDARGERAFSLFTAAERDRRTVRFLYEDKEGRRERRVVDPYGFIVSGGRVYCVGYDHSRKAERVFALDNVDEPEMLARTFLRRPDFDVHAFAGASISGLVSGEARFDARVRFDARIAKAAIAARVVHTRDVQRQPDGSVEITYHIADPQELMRWVLGWGAQAELLAPAELRRQMEELARSIAQRYLGDA
ncbi:MAG: helix-turn-helix transcriptional regulator [Vulcanimicrobiaceae bacterium]